MKKVALHNLGCKVNAYETEAMQEMMESAGYEIVPFAEGADIYIINTCTVTNIADRKSRQMLHRARKMNPDAIVVATGCYVQAQENEARQQDSCIDIVIGNNKKQELPEILEKYMAGRETAETAPQTTENMAEPKENLPQKNEAEQKIQQREVIDINHTKEYEYLHLSRTGERTRAYIKVQDGCNQFCSYCIIPLARGRVRSRRKEDVVQEAAELAAGGCQEIVLTGIHLSSYGVDLEGENLLSLILALHEINGIRRIRLGSLEPGIITEEFVRTVSALPKMCPHFHLSLQSGCDATLKRMNRRYTSAEYYDKCMLLRKYFDNPALTTDVIVGFPGETEEEFAQSKAFVDKVNFYETHIFKYSRREGTRAAEMKNQVPESVKTVRSSSLIELGGRKQKLYEQSLYGREVEILVEEKIFVDGRSMQTGHTREYVKVAFDAEEDLRNQIVKMQMNHRLQIIH